MPLVGASATPMSPSAAIRPAFLAAFASPFLRSQSTAVSRSPPLSPSATLQSIIPAPVLSRSSFTMLAVMFAMSVGPHLLLGAGNPRFDASGKADLLADIVGGGR